ncbi:efflux RND transporter periplasmic adaptor subunit [Roseomonas alkaliterrae]|uniref:RND family efflux transporter MFP subunit n=1 Tax=Neoroseomonas alkaliterrae TaxID=1452450 RepID=A0A840XHS3_9PROT|nr:efflux RND transporter periplasmic adaptor subunit [Neoroseomonas alkaliterrae]MBB5688025.1 RND family efflux transporter MFP subunit [Neoroseomonas alkaliterrae]MBR0677140.1 efflux RND transporter periplasmic adaptor subunit [Neoroseomonas alkaliterrae]
MPPAVAIAMATQGPALRAVYATGSVEPVHWAKVGPSLRARITEVLVEEGQRVSEGQAMARLDNREAVHRVEEAEARARFAEEELARIRTLVARDIAARASLDRAEAEARAVRAAAEAARRRLDDYVVRAPADGLVLRRDAEVGEVVDTPAALFWIGEPRPLRVTAEVDEEDIAQVREGQDVLLRADAFPGRVLTATVAQITPKGDATRKAYRVRLALPEDTPLLIGMTVEANIVLRRTEDAVLVPPAAVRDGRVFVVRQQVVERRTVELGIEGPRAVEVRHGLARGEAVVLDPPTGLADGQAVRLRP